MQNNPELVAAVTQALGVWSETLANPKPVTDLLIRAWVLVLTQQGVTPAEVEEGAGKLLTLQTFFPTPADFLKVIRPPVDEDARVEVAWQQVLHVVRTVGRGRTLTAEHHFGGDALALWAVDRMGWERICQELTVDNRAIWAAEFRRIYRAGMEMGARLGVLVGEYDRENMAAGYQDAPKLPASTPALPEDGLPHPRTLIDGHREK